MAKAKWIVALLAGPIVLAGCGNAQRDARQKLADGMEKARRLYGHASSLLARPQFTDEVTGETIVTSETVKLKNGQLVSGQVERQDKVVVVKLRSGQTREIAYAEIEKITGYRLPSPEISVPTQPATEPSDRPVELLNEAAGTVETALNEAKKIDPDLPAGLVGDAQLLLGKIAYLRGTYHTRRAEDARSRLAVLRRACEGLSATVRNQSMLAGLQGKLAAMPRDEVSKLKKQVSDELGQVQGKIDAINGQVATLEKEIQGLVSENESKLKKSRALRDEADAGGGVKLVRDAQAIEAEVNANEGKVNANQDKLASLKVDKDLLAQQAGGLNTCLDLLNQHLAKMDERSGEFKRALAESEQAVAVEYDKLATTLSQVAATAGKLADAEKEALDAMTASADHLAKATGLIGQEHSAAVATRRQLRTDEKPVSAIVETLADDAHLVSAMGLKAAANQRVGDLLCAQFATVEANQRLAADIKSLADKAGKPVPPAVDALATYASGAADAKTAAERYIEAEKDLNAILDNHLKSGAATHTKWLYQAKLADAYLAHYQLTPSDASLRASAEKFVNEALAGKAASPYLAGVRSLKRLIEKSGPAGAGGSSDG